MVPKVVTPFGEIRGVERDGHFAFLGIPYAMAPVGVYRFAPPSPTEPWDEPIDATSFAKHTPQSESVMETFFNDGVPPEMDEATCLSLNIWTPRIDSRRRPVMVWIHGGGYTAGSASTSMYDGGSFAVNHDVVLVSFNYRLGVLGFTYLAQHGEDLESSGSLGVQDAAAALRWVAANIVHFGGDPNNVTVFGESAGAMSVGTLLGMPECDGLFSKAILQSGASSNVISPSEAERRTTMLLEQLGRPDATVHELRDLSIDELLAAHERASGDHGIGLFSCPVVDGDVLVEPPLDHVTSGHAAGVKLLIGTNLDEWNLFTMGNANFAQLTEEEAAAILATHTTRSVSELASIYEPRLGTTNTPSTVSAALTDSVFRAPAIRLAEAQLAGGGHAWMYLFTWPSPLAGGTLGSCHGVEIPFVFNSTDTTSGQLLVGDAAPKELAAAVHATWAAFARHGDPSQGPLGDWPEYTLERRATKVIGESSYVEDDPLAAEREAWS